MKGTFFQKPLEFRLEVQGESWRQGDEVAGQLTVRNRGGDAAALEGVQVALAYGELRKVRLKAPDAFETLEAAALGGGMRLEPEKETSFPWRFRLERNCPITDASGSLFLLYGPGAAPERLGQLQLLVAPAAPIEELLGVLGIGFRFVVKTRKAGKNGVEIKLAPPSGRSFAMLDHLLLQARFEGERLRVRYVFNVKKIEASAASFEMKKSKLETEQAFDPPFDSARLEAAAREALAQVESKIVF